MGGCCAVKELNINVPKYFMEDQNIIFESKSDSGEDEYLISYNDGLYGYKDEPHRKYSSNGIFNYKYDYNISKKDKGMKRTMSKITSEYVNTYIDEVTHDLKKYIEINKMTNEIILSSIIKKVKASDMLREMSKQVVTNNVSFGYDKKIIIAILEFSARAMDGFIEENDFQKLVYGLSKHSSNLSNELVDNDKLITILDNDKNITIKENQINQFIENYLALDYFLELEDNWNNNGAKHFSKEIIKKMKNIIKELKYQPEIFPTARESIQFEYEENGAYLEFELFENNILKIFTLSSNDEEKTESEELDVVKVVKVVSEFYE